MVLELHVWGPAFGLPSVDAECLAAIACLNRTVATEDWRLVADYDTSISPRHEFPLLVGNNVRATGFSEIFTYLTNHHDDLDSHLTQEQRSDRTAFTSFIQSTGGPLIDLSLYISSENYNATTSSAYTAILPWYLNYTIPPARRDQARARTAHLGLSSLDVSTIEQDPSQPGGRSANSSFEAAKREAGMAGQPKVLSLGRKAGVGGLLSSPIYAARFKLDALANELLEPLSELLGKKDYLLEGNAPSSLDCIAFSYLALMLYPAVPQAWLKEALEVRFPRLGAYVQRMRKDLLEDEHVNAADIWAVSSSNKDESEIQSTLRQLGLHLPWRPHRSRAVYSTFGKATLELASKFPLFSTVLKPQTIIQDNAPAPLTRIRSSLPSPTAVNILCGFSAAVLTAVATMATQHRRSPRDGPLIFWALRPQSTGFGEAGDFLSVFANNLRV